MISPPHSPEKELQTWLFKQPRWLQHATAAILRGDAIGADRITDFARMAVSEAQGDLAPPESPPDLAALGMNTGSAVSLRSLSEISGVGQLHPRGPLHLGTETLVVVHGPTGSGKSSYVRILKHACGARFKGPLHEDVFASASPPQSCKISFADAAGDHEITWNPTAGVTAPLSTIDIFDTHSGNAYLTSEGEATYEPRPLLFLSALANLCDRVAAKLSAAIDAKTTSLPALPHESAVTAIGRWYQNLTPQTDAESVEKNSSWTTTDEQEQADLAKYLAERSPKDRAKELEAKKGVLDGLISSLSGHCEAFSDEACQKLMGLRKAARDAQQTAEAAAKVNLRDAVLEGVGTKQWLALWDIARSYSIEIAYPGFAFPHTEGEVRCPLCHQPLSREAKSRLKSFEQYVTDQAATAAKVAKQNLATAIEALPALPDDETNEARCAGAGVTDQNRESLESFYALLRARRDLLLTDAITEDFGPFPKTSEWIAAAQPDALAYGAKAREFLESFSEQDRATKLARQRELTTRKWVAAQKAAIEYEIKRLEKVALLEKAKELCSTRAISVKKGALAEELITQAYIKAFNSELKGLGAGRIRVELLKTRVERGALLHRVQLRAAMLDRPIGEVLSEGEHRIVCIAAFLADVASKPNGSTFVFDDPISSLDIDFEEAVVRRIVDLSKTRQVIVFTHRLSLLGMIQDYAKKTDVETRVIHIRREPWGAGEPGDPSIDAARPKAILNEHLPKRIVAAKSVFEKEGMDGYCVHGQALCTEIRKLIERLIEIELLGDVIQRHRRAINTLGKLDKLADIQPEDCALLDEMMTKYSRYEHAQSPEAPVELPQPEELLQDVATLKEWRDGLEARRK